MTMTGAALLMPAAGVTESSAAASPSLARAAAKGGRYYGAAARFDQIGTEHGLGDALALECSQLTPEIHMKWDQIERTRGDRRFEQADGLVAFARKRNLAVRGHTLLWDQSTPDWAKAAIADGDWSVIAKHFEAMLMRYRDAVEEWDVINEPIDTVAGKDGLRRNCFHSGFGPGYIGRALHEARRLAPNAKLMINDYGFDYNNSVETDRRERFIKLLTKLRRDNIPLDGVGIQAHLDLSKGPISPDIIAPFLQRIADLDLFIVITELDVKEQGGKLPVAERDRRVADQVSQYLEIALAQTAVKGVVTWGLSDRHSWLSDPNSNLPNRGLPYDASLARKPMYWAMRDAFLRQSPMSAG